MGQELLAADFAADGSGPSILSPGERSRWFKLGRISLHSDQPVEQLYTGVSSQIQPGPIKQEKQTIAFNRTVEFKGTDNKQFATRYYRKRLPCRGTGLVKRRTLQQSSFLVAQGYCAVCRWKISYYPHSTLIAATVCAELGTVPQFQHEGTASIVKPEIPGWQSGPDLAEMTDAQFMPYLRGCVGTENKTGVEPFPYCIKWVHGLYPVVVVV